MQYKNKFQEWMKTTETSFSEAAEAMQCSEAAVKAYFYGQRKPDMEIMPRMFDFTNGFVDANSWYGIPQAEQRGG